MDFDFMREDSRQAEWDRFLSDCPVCARCGEHITDRKLVYIPTHDEFFCLDCIDSMTEFNEAAEVD